MSSNDSKDTRATPPPIPSRRLLVVLVLVALLGTAMGVSVLFSDRTPLLEAAAFAAAQDRWEKHRPDSYTVVVRKEFDGGRSERIVTTVEDGSVVELRIEGQKISPLRDSYTIDGLFDILERELEMASLAGEPLPGQPRDVVLRAEFAASGVPTVFKRISAGGKSVFLYVESVEPPLDGES